MSAGLARKWDYYDDEDEGYSNELRVSDYTSQDFEEEYDEAQDDYEYEHPQANFIPAPLSVEHSRYAPHYPAASSAAYSQPYAYERPLALPSPDGRDWFGAQNGFGPTEAVYAYSFDEAQPRRQPLSSFLESFVAGVSQQRWLVVVVALVALGFIISTGLNWLSSRSDSKGEIYSFAGSGGVVLGEKPQSQSQPAPQGNPPAVAPGAHSVEGKPSITVAKIEQVLKQYNSPAVGSGQAMYDLGVKYGIDPAYALAFFVHESTAGTKGIAVNTKSIGNIRQTANSGYDAYEGFRKYPTWEVGMEDWYKLIRNLYIQGWNLRTVETIVPKYAPAADRNNPPSYINQVNQMVEGWRSGK